VGSGESPLRITRNTPLGRIDDAALGGYRSRHLVEHAGGHKQRRPTCKAGNSPAFIARYKVICDRPSCPAVSATLSQSSPSGRLAVVDSMQFTPCDPLLWVS
jgi:hypothetical protein